MRITTDIRTITSKHIALDWNSGSGDRILAKVLGTMPDGALRLLLINRNQRAFYKDGILYRTTDRGRQEIGNLVIVWQGRLPGEHQRDLRAGLDKVARRIAADASGIVDYVEMPVTIGRGKLRDLADRLALISGLDKHTLALIEEAREAAV